MASRMIHQRVWKVSSELDKLALLCEQHKLQVEHREGLPDWEEPRTPAGVSSARKERVPAFFAWNDDKPQRPESQQPEQEPGIQRTPTRKQHREADNRETTVDSAVTPERVMYASPGRRETAEVVTFPTEIDDSEGREEATAIVVADQGDEPSEEVYSDEDSPTSEDQIVRGPPPMTVPVSRTLTPQRTVEASQSPYHASSSPRYRYGRRLKASDAVIPSPRGRSLAAGIPTVDADRYRMNKSSGKRFRSPAKRTSLWEDLCNSYIHQTNSSSRNDVRFAKKRLNQSGANNRNNSSSVYRTLNMDTYSWPQSGSARGERRRILTGPAAMEVTNRAVRDFLDDNEESKSSDLERSLQQVQDLHRNVDRTSSSPVVVFPERTFATSTTAFNRPEPNNFRKRKTVSFGDENSIQPLTRGGVGQRTNDNEHMALPSAHTVLSDKTTQTDDALLAAHNCPVRSRNQPQFDRDHQETSHDSFVRCSTCDTVLDDAGHRRKIYRRSNNSPGRAQSSSSYHLTNPILLNPRYPPEPTTFRGRSSYSTVFDNRSSRR